MNKRQSRSRYKGIIESPSATTPTSENVPLSNPNLTHLYTYSDTSSPTSTRANIVQRTLKDAQIDSHFPFDPYKLPLSAVFIEGIYRNWESDDEDSSTDHEEEGDADPSYAGSLTAEADENSMKGNEFLDSSLLEAGKNEEGQAFSKSFEAMSVSPKRII